ncbi:YceI family protein [Nemorincola caseinilytica]|uniref:YceI family protein n=1 Tax=Nemorincola caseinilytica TaxID=2054315 RepID=A0ABP8NE60_9BACT
MKKISTFIAAAMLFVASSVTAQTKWNVDASHSNVKFSVSHLVISEVEGSFTKFNGSIDAPAADFNNAKVEFTVDVNSINTDNEGRDKHLKSDDFFNAEKFPQMTFKSTSFKKGKGNNYVMEGDLTIRDVTKKVKFDVAYGGSVVDPWGNTKAGFKTTTKISRKAYGLMWNKMTEAGGAVVGDEVTIILKLEFGKAK